MFFAAFLGSGFSVFMGGSFHGFFLAFLNDIPSFLEDIRASSIHFFGRFGHPLGLDFLFLSFVLSLPGFDLSWVLSITD